MTLTTVLIITKSGSLYSYPRVVDEAFRAVIVPMLNCPGSMDTVSIANTDKAVLSVPFDMIKEIHIGDQKVWSCSA